MAKRRSPYEIEPLSASLHVTAGVPADDALAKHTHKGNKTKKKSSSAVNCSSDGGYGVSRSGRGNQEKQSAGGSGLALVTDAERDVMNAVDAKLAALASKSSESSSHSTSRKRKQMVELRSNDISGGGGNSEKSSSPEKQQQVMSIETLEQKKMLLPYLEKIEYINYQLQMRGLLPDTMMKHQQEDGSPQPDPALAVRQSVIPDKRPTPFAGMKALVKPSDSRSSSSSQTASGSQQVATRNQEASALEEAARDSELQKRVKSISPELLRARYPRLFETIEEPSRLVPRTRPITWLLKLIEDIYDVLSGTLLPSPSVAMRTEDASSSESPQSESMVTSLSPAPVKRIHGATSGKLALPLFTRRYLHHTLGLPSLADQDSLDLLMNIEATKDRLPQVALFSNFLRELFDSDALLFFVALRSVAQRELELQLSSKEKLARTSSGKKYLRGDLLEVVPHKLIPDGTKQVLLFVNGCETVLRKLFTWSLELRLSQSDRAVDSKIPTAFVLAQYMAKEKLRSLFSNPSENKGENDDRAVIEDFFTHLVDIFREVSEDIVAQFKYNDDGESLTNLIRLRDTISCDSKIDKMLVTYSEQERVVRNLKIEFTKMERANASGGDNKFRTQLCLLQNRIRLHEQELQHIQSEVSATEARVNDVWREVVQPHAPKRSKLTTNSSPKRPSVPSSSSLITELTSVLGRFEFHIARLQRKHEIEVKASALLAKPWKQQMEELEMRMVVRIQRVYRARKRAREAKAQALEKLRDQVRERELKVKNEQMDRKRLQALQDKDLQRHQTRLQAKKVEEELAKQELAAKQNALIKKLRDEEIAQRALKRSRELQTHSFTQWTNFVIRRRKRWQANKLFLKFKMVKWKAHFSAYKVRVNAAIRIQQLVRNQQRRVQFRRMLNQRIKRSRIAKKYLTKVHLRQLSMLFNHWCSFTRYNQNLKANFQTTLQRRTGYWFQQWVNFTCYWKLRLIQAASLIQRVYRGRIARQVVRYQRRRHENALTIQRVYRGYKSRVVVKLLRQIRAQQNGRCALLLQRIQLREVHLCFCRLRLHSDWELAVKRMTENRRIACQHSVLTGWTQLVLRKQAKRAAFLRKQYESAMLIQRNYRRHRCQTLFHDSIRFHRAAIVIQRVVRGFQGRERAKKRRWERNAAIALQSAWRKRRATKLAAAIRTEKILLGAFKGDYSATKRAIASGFWYVADQEGNGILHMAAAASHKRIIKLCLRNNFDINAVTRRGQTPLHLLLANLPSYTGKATGGERFVSGEDSLQQERIDKVALAAYMIDHGAWHEAADEDGITPLLLCSVLGQTDAVEMLLEREANTDARSSSGMLNAVQLATEGNHWHTLQALLASRGFDYDQSAKDTVRLLHACAGRGLIDCLRVLITHIQQRFDTFPDHVLDTADDEGYTPLIYALTNGFVDIVQCLLENDAGPDVKDYFGRSPLHFAVSYTDPVVCEAMVKLLTLYEADVNVKDNDGDAPLHVCSDCDDRLACTSLLLTHGALICSNALGNHATHIAATHGAVATLKLLVQYGGDMNLKNYDGKTPLGMARMHNQKAVVQYIAHYFAQEALEETGAASEAVEEDNQGQEDAIPDLAESKDDEAVLIGNDATQDTEDGNEEPSNQQRPTEMTLADWQDALASSFWMGQLAEWTQYVDTKTDVPFYCCEATNPDEAPVCTWEPPPEFEASMGEEWGIVRTTNRGGSTRKLSTPTTASSGELSPGRSSAVSPQYLYHNKVTDEVRASVPPINYALLQDVVQNSKRQKLLRAKIHKIAASDTSASAMEYLRFFHAFEEESAQTRAEIHAAIAIQRHFRAKRTRERLKTLLHENRSALNLQRTFRGRKARRFAALKRQEHVDATRIQSAWRGFTARKQERLVLHGQRVAHRRRKLAALKIQRLFRGWIGRKAWYREKVVTKLGPRGYFAWEQLRQRAVIVRSFKVWDELIATQDFPGVLFYCHQVTRACSWEKSKEWAIQDYCDFEERRQLVAWGYTQQMKLAAVRLQRLWRARLARLSFQMILKAVKIMQTCEQEYLEEPTNLVKMGNYVLYLHTVTHDYERARPLYGRLMRMMAQRGPDVAFILLSYGLFLHVTQEEDATLVEEMILRGKLKDPTLSKYRMAFLGFFRQSMVQNPHSAESNLNYASCVQWLYEQYDEATKYYLRAIAANPHKKGAMELFQEMLTRKREVDRLKLKLKAKPWVVKHGNKAGKQQDDSDAQDSEAQYDGFEVFRRWQAKQAQDEDQQRRAQFEAEKAASERLASARKIQARYRRRLAMRRMNKLKLERQMGASIAELATQKAVYDRVIMAFDLLAVDTSAPSKLKFTIGSKKAPPATKTRPLSVPIAKLDFLFQGMNIGLSANEVASASVHFRETHPKLQNVNVMDICAFADADPVLKAKVQEAKSATSLAK